MMVTAASLFALAAASAVEVQGPSRCPTAAEVADILPEMLPAAEATYPDLAWIEAVGPDLQIELRSPAGEVLFSRRLSSSGTCADLATIAAVVIASWTAERNPGISLLQPGVPAPTPTPTPTTTPTPTPAPTPMPPPTPPPRPSPPAPQVGSGDRAVAPPEHKREFELALGLGSSVNSAGFVGAVRVDAGLRGRRLGVRAGFAAETERSETIETRSVSWRRYSVSLEPSLVIVREPVMLDARAGIFAGFTTVAGHGFDVDRQSSAAAAGLSLAVRLAASSGWLRPWMEVGGQYWLADQEITIARAQQPNLGVSLPHAEARLFAGVSLVLSR
jgi:hypothetical protein